ncbi:tRNA (guanine(37)-N1)-methyltransferase [Nosema granulosis]|uniref:tRNA (guanine(37)-N1)-methyltransferase n=1 Tax=Nosema granulosis TaxID=83296 RepID=A0A9P6H484_9MICR|nr:tRNA (guanine(37)-N1)-methyltransferase [Nosema granulosis]
MKIIVVDAVAVNKDQIKDVLFKFNKKLLKMNKIPSILDKGKKYNGIEIITKTDTTHFILLKSPEEDSIKLEIKLTYDFYTSHEILSHYLPTPPSSFETVGNVVHMNLREEHLPYKYLIGKVIHDKTSCIVINKLGNINNTFRNFEFEVIGDNWIDFDALKEQQIVFHEERTFRIAYKSNVVVPEKYPEELINSLKIKEITVDSLETVHFECGLRFIVDIKNCYWCSKLQGERQRLLQDLKEGEVFCDLFCGVGPMVLPALKKGCTVVCNDLNPNAVDCLKRSLKKNKLDASKVDVYNLDAKEFLEIIKERKVDHFFLNLPEHSLEHLQYLKQFKGNYKVHCYFFCNDNFDVVDFVYQTTGVKYKNNQISLVRKVSPSKNMYKLTYVNN